MKKIYFEKLIKTKNELSNKVEWIYSGDKIDRDAYLLGKPIDKLIIEKEIDKRNFFKSFFFLINLKILKFTLT